MARRKHLVYEDGQVVSWTYWSLSEELWLNARIHYWKLMKAAVGAPPWPADIDEWKARWNPMAAVDLWLTWKGQDPATVPTQLKYAAMSGIEMGLVAGIFFHRDDWQGIFDGVVVDEDA